MKSNRNSFKGSLGFIMAAAGSAVGLGNIWRFPYLAAKDGGGLFLAAYIIILLTFGFTLLITEVSIGRKTKQSPLTAYGKLSPAWEPLGIIACLVPVIIMPYYCVIGGWVLKYLVTFIVGEGLNAASDNYFASYITSQPEPVIYMIIFIVLSVSIVFRGVNKGIEATSKIIMPILVVLVVFISIYALTISYTDDSGVTRTGIDGLKVYVIPDFSDMTINSLSGVILDAMGQLFFSLSVAMGIMITYGSYVSDHADIGKAINHIEIFDTIIAFLAGVMVIPAVYVFMGAEGMKSSGPGLMFVSLPKVFAAMGSFGRVIGIMFFAMVLFAAITSIVSMMEAVVSSFIDKFHITRKKAVCIVAAISLTGAVVVCLGYNMWYFELNLPNGAVAQILDIMDYVSNNCLMPIVAIGTCILVGWVIKPKSVIDEVEKTGNRFGRKKLYIVMIKYIAPILLTILLIKSIGILG